MGEIFAWEGIVGTSLIMLIRAELHQLWSIIRVELNQPGSLFGGDQESGKFSEPV